MLGRSSLRAARAVASTREKRKMSDAGGEAIELLAATADVLRALYRDPALPPHAKAMILSHAARIDRFLQRAGDTEGDSFLTE